MTERRCILTGDHADPESLIRLAISPDGLVLPDIRGKAPGRGAWLGVSRDALETAMAKGKLRGALARAFKGEPLEVPPDLPERIEVQLRQQMLDRLGLEARASAAITGFDKIDTAARKGQVHLLLHAADAAGDGNAKLDSAWRVGRDMEGSGERGIILPLDRNALSMAMGRENVVHIAIIQQEAAKRLTAMLDRWQNYRGCVTAAPARIQAAGAGTSSATEDDTAAMPQD